ncbi:MAG: hypothetical protein H7A32_04045 [Deltaproteobacteria bacterium]|nr:hypothetical protein [Deltaproteobacteria bacterium]
MTDIQDQKGWIHLAYDAASEVAVDFTQKLIKGFEPSHLEYSVNSQQTQGPEAHTTTSSDQYLSSTQGLSTLIKDSPDVLSPLGVGSLFLTQPHQEENKKPILDIIYQEGQNINEGAKIFITRGEEEYSAKIFVEIGILAGLAALGGVRLAAQGLRNIGARKQEKHYQEYTEQTLTPMKELSDLFEKQSASPQERFMAAKLITQHLTQCLGEDIITRICHAETLYTLYSAYSEMSTYAEISPFERELIYHPSDAQKKALMNLKNDITAALINNAKSKGVSLDLKIAQGMAASVLHQIVDPRFLYSWAVDPHILKKLAVPSDSDSSTREVKGIDVIQRTISKIVFYGAETYYMTTDDKQRGQFWAMVEGLTELNLPEDLAFLKDEGLLNTLRQGRRHSITHPFQVDLLAIYAPIYQISKASLVTQVVTNSLKIKIATDLELNHLVSQVSDLRSQLIRSIQTGEAISRSHAVLASIDNDAYSRLLRGELNPKAFTAEVIRVAVDIFKIDPNEVDPHRENFIARAEKTRQIISVLAPKTGKTGYTSKLPLDSYIELIAISSDLSPESLDVVAEIQKLFNAQSSARTNSEAFNRVLRYRLAAYIPDDVFIPELAREDGNTLQTALHTIQATRALLAFQGQQGEIYRDANAGNAALNPDELAKKYIQALYPKRRLADPNYIVMSDIDLKDLETRIQKNMTALAQLETTHPRAFQQLLAYADQASPGTREALQTAEARSETVQKLLSHTETAQTSYQEYIHRVLKNGQPRAALKIIQELINESFFYQRPGMTALAHSYPKFLEWLRQEISKPKSDQEENEQRHLKRLLDMLPPEGSPQAANLEDAARLDLLIGIFEQYHRAPRDKQDETAQQFFGHCALMLAGDLSNYESDANIREHLDRLINDILTPIANSEGDIVINIPSHLGFGDQLTITNTHQLNHLRKRARSFTDSTLSTPATRIPGNAIITLKPQRNILRPGR